MNDDDDGEIGDDPRWMRLNGNEIVRRRLAGGPSLTLALAGQLEKGLALSLSQ